MSGASQIFGAIGKDQQARSQTNYRNQLAIRRHEDANRMADYKDQQAANLYRARVANYDRSKMSILGALRDSQFRSQINLNQAYDQAAFQGQEDFSRELEAIGKINASGMTGGSADRARALMKGAFDRNQAITSYGLSQARLKSRFENTDAVNRAQSQLNQAYSNVAVAPMPTYRASAPMMESMPNRMGLAAGLLGAVGSTTLGIAGIDWDEQ